MATKRKIVESPLWQGKDEQIAYKLTTTPWGSTPSSVAVALYDVTTEADTDVSATSLSGTAGVSGDVITTPVVKLLTAGNIYRLEIKFTVNSNVTEAFAYIMAEA